MQPVDAMDYGIIDKIVQEEKDIVPMIDAVKSSDQWDKEVRK